MWYCCFVVSWCWEVAVTVDGHEAQLQAAAAMEEGHVLTHQDSKISRIVLLTACHGAATGEARTTAMKAAGRSCWQELRVFGVCCCCTRRVLLQRYGDHQKFKDLEKGWARRPSGVGTSSHESFLNSLLVRMYVRQYHHRVRSDSFLLPYLTPASP